MTGHEYANLIADYLVENFSDRGIIVYREVNIGKSIIGKNRRVDLFVLCGETAYAIECKYQDSSGTADEKMPYALENMRALNMGGCIVYAGMGFSVGVLHMLQASEMAAYCLPTLGDLQSNKETRELDHLLAMHFGWWDLLISGKKPWTKRPDAEQGVLDTKTLFPEQTELLA
jgi:hypothetical protein